MALFSSTQPSLRARVLPRFPANVIAGTGISIEKSGGTYTFSIDFAEFSSYSSTLRVGFDEVITPPSDLQVSSYLDTDIAGQSAVRIRGIVSGDTPSTVSYEKTALNVGAITLEPSDYSGPVITRDCVGAEIDGLIEAPNMQGRVWGIDAGAAIASGADGAACGMELFVDNSGSDQPLLDQTTTKLIQQYVAFSGPVTCGAYFNAGAGGSYHKVIHCKAGVIATGGTFLSLENTFAVDAFGNLFTFGSISTAPSATVLVNGLNSNITGGGILRISGPSGAFSVGGFSLAVGQGDHLTIYNSTTQQMTIVNEDLSSTAGLRIKTLTGANVVLRAGTSAASFIYDDSDQRWILISTN